MTTHKTLEEVEAKARELFVGRYQVFRDSFNVTVKMLPYESPILRFSDRRLVKALVDECCDSLQHCQAMLADMGEAITLAAQLEEWMKQQ